jgi:hypothetical protein
MGCVSPQVNIAAALVDLRRASLLVESVREYALSIHHHESAAQLRDASTLINEQIKQVEAGAYAKVLARNVSQR